MCVILAALSLPCLASTGLEDDFRNPPDSAKQHNWWHWMNGNVSKEGITADLEAMADVGIGGLSSYNGQTQAEGYLRWDWGILRQIRAKRAGRVFRSTAVRE